MPPPQIVFEPSHSYEDALHKAADEWGIEREFWDIFGKRHVPSAAIESRILSALGMDTSSQKTIEDQRIRRFQRRVMLPIQPVSITSEQEKWIILSLAKSYTSADIEVAITLESGEQLRANYKLGQLKDGGRVAAGVRSLVRVPVAAAARGSARLPLVACPDRRSVGGGGPLDRDA